MPVLTNKTSTEVAKEYRARLREKQSNWNADARPGPQTSREFTKAATARTLDVLGLGDDIDDFVRSLDADADIRELSFHEALNVLEASLRNDIKQCLSDSEKLFFETVQIHFLPTGLHDACCVDSDVDGKKLGYFIAFLNEGLYFALVQLLTALVLEKVQGDLAKFRQDGRSDFEAAINLYLHPDPKNAKHTSPGLGRVDASGEMNAYIHSTASLLLQFISLHEFAHAWLGHHQILDVQNLSMGARVVHVSNTETEELSRELEYAADEFAFRAIMRRTEEIQSHWAHCILIYLYFCYLDALEKRIGQKLSDRHPAPMKRANCIREILKQEFPDDTDYEAELDEIDALILKWTA